MRCWGDGTQTKSYLHIDDCVDAFPMTLDGRFWQTTGEVRNIDSEDQANILTIARIIVKAMHLNSVTARIQRALSEEDGLAI